MKKPQAVVLGLATAALCAVTVMAAKPFTHATGGIGLSGPLQYVSFAAFDYAATGDRGTVNYANFDYAAPGTGVWDVRGTNTLTVHYGGDYAHTMTIDTIVPVSTTASKFTGTGVYLGDASYTWTVIGLVSGSDISFTLVYTGGPYTGYTFSAEGTIAADGSMSGTATDSLARSLTWSMPAGPANEVLSYTAPVVCAVIAKPNATFGFTIPPGFPPSLSGLEVVFRAYDGGTPGANGDTWLQAAGDGISCASPGAFTAYDIVSGNLVVHE